MTTKLEQNTISVNFAFVAPMVELADTPVLGTGLSRGESSNLSKPTNKMSALVKLADKIRSCVACCVESNLLRNEMRRVRYSKGFCPCRRLRKCCTPHSLPHTYRLFNNNNAFF